MTSLREFWDSRYEHFNLRESGNLGYSTRYNKWYYKGKKRILDAVLNRFGGNLHDKHVVDVGSGTGFFIDYFAQRNAARILGVDVSEKSAGFLKGRFAQYPNVEIRCLDISANDFKIHETFHIANVYDLFYLIVDDQAFGRALQNISKMVLGEGLIFIVDMFPDSEVMLAKYIKCRPLKVYKELLSEHNIKVLELIPQFFLMNRDRQNRVLYYFQNALPSLAYYADGMALSLGLHGDGDRSGASFKLMVAKKNS